jgi:hypothetical protein
VLRRKGFQELKLASRSSVVSSVADKGKLLFLPKQKGKKTKSEAHQ